ncbi:MAG TPA: alpha/beta hydrolase [Bacillota bacterium]|nr:alpha/beta hydrolase [Fastidiosipila sp.]HPX93228.1 alpha/beta hydrolase [Bacillota bacterium]HQB81072.1 alpha/beta hydrolase [Bacillota bacterium]
MAVSTVFLAAVLPRGLVIALYLMLALGLAFAAFVIQLGWALFRYASRRADSRDFTPPADIPPETLEWYKTAALARERLLLRPHQDWEMVRDGLVLRGIYFPAREGASGSPAGKGCALLVHGWRDVRLSRAPDVQMYLEQGYDVFLPFLRGHEPSGGKRIDIGCKHSRDLFAWMEEIRKRSGDKTPSFFVLDGLSMGAANVLTASGDPDLPGDVAAVIADCGYTSLKAQGQWMIRGMKPLLRCPAFFFATVFFFLFMGYSRKDPTPLTGVARARVPVMIIHGSKDVFVPAFMAEELWQACHSELKELWYVEGAGHAMSQALAGDSYRERKRAFIEKALERFQPDS